MTSWHTPETARDQWADAPLDDDELTVLLEVARTQVVAYSPARKTDEHVQPESTTVPVTYRLAQLRQAQNVWNAGAVSPDGGLGDGGDFVIRPHPLDWHVKQIIRPRRAMPNVR